MKIDHLMYFYETSQRKSLNESAKYLHLTQPSLSASIRSLEEELGIKLFYRTRNGIFITEQGKKALEHIKIILEQYQILLSLKNSAAFHGRPVILSTSRTLSRVFLSPELMECIQSGQLIVHSSTMHDDPLETRFDDERCHLCLRFYPKDMLSLVRHEVEHLGWRIVPLATGSVCFFINSALELAKKQKIELRDLEPLTFATSSKVLKLTYDYNKIFMQAACIKNHVVFPDRQTIFEAISKSEHIYTVSPKLDISDNLLIRQGVVAARECADFSIPLTFCLVLPSSRELYPVEKDIALFIRKQFARMQSASLL